MRNPCYLIVVAGVAACSIPDVTFRPCKFKEASVSMTGPNPASIAVADVNGDDRPDLVVANKGDGTVSVLLGNGDGTFHPLSSGAIQTSCPTAASISVAVGNIIGDSNPDIAIANASCGLISVLLNDMKNSGTFQLMPSLSIMKGAPPSVALASLVRGSSKLDVVATDFGSGGLVSVFLNNGMGNFGSETQYQAALNGSPWAVVVTDVIVDGQPDLVVTNRDLNTVSVFPGNGKGTFHSTSADSVMSSPPDQNGAVAIAVTDLNGDHRPDLVVAHSKTDFIGVMFQNDSGTFDTEMTYPTESSPKSVVAADVDGDRQPDILVANQDSHSVSVFHVNSDGSLTQEGTCPTGKSPEAIAVADVNGDGQSDLIVANSGEDTVSVLLAR